MPFGNLVSNISSDPHTLVTLPDTRLIILYIIAQLEAEFYGLKDLMFPASSSSSPSQSTRSTRSQSNPPEQASQSPYSQSNFPESPGQCTHSQSNFQVESNAPCPNSQAMPYNPPPPFVPAHVATQHHPSSFMPYLPIPPVTVPCTYTGTHIAISQVTITHRTLPTSHLTHTPYVIVPCTYTGTHIAISQGSDHTSNPIY